MEILLRAARGTAIAVAALLAGGCGADQGNQPPAAPEVGVIVVQPQRATISAQLPGRTVAFRIAQVRPQVSGIIKERLYTEGAEVRAGQALYQLDPAPYQAAYDSAQAAVAKASANTLDVRLRYARVQKLAASGDVSQQDRDDVTASLSQAEADEKTAHAALETRAHQPRLHAHRRADRRTHGHVGLHRGRAGHGQAGRPADHGAAARPSMST